MSGVHIFWCCAVPYLLGHNDKLTLPGGFFYANGHPECAFQEEILGAMWVGVDWVSTSRNVTLSTSQADIASTLVRRRQGSPVD